MDELKRRHRQAPIRNPTRDRQASHRLPVSSMQRRIWIDEVHMPVTWGCPAFLLNIEKRSLPRLMLSGDGLASNVAV